MKISNVIDGGVVKHRQVLAFSTYLSEKHFRSIADSLDIHVNTVKYILRPKSDKKATPNSIKVVDKALELYRKLNIDTINKKHHDIISKRYDPRFVGSGG